MKRFTRYAAVGAFATAVHYALLGLVVEVVHGPAWLGSGIGAAVGAQIGFIANRRITFAHDGPVGPAWIKFQSTALAGALLGMVIVATGVGWGLHYLLAQAIATLAVLVLGFSVNRMWTFGRSPELAATPAPGARPPPEDPP